MKKQNCCSFQQQKELTMKAEQFCHAILENFLTCSKAIANLVMSTAAGGAGSITALSGHPIYRYKYSSVSKSIAAVSKQYRYERGKEPQPVPSENIVSAIIREPVEEVVEQMGHLTLNTDCTSLFREHSPCLPGRSHVHKPNVVVKGNKPVGIGYSMSTICLNLRRRAIGTKTPGWNPPLDMQLVPPGKNKNAFTAEQVESTLEREKEVFREKLTVNNLDCDYCSPEYIAGVSGQKNLVSIIRIADNRNVWKNVGAEEQAANKAKHKDNRGAALRYGSGHNLRDYGQWGIEADDTACFCRVLENGRRCEVGIEAWHGMKLRSKRKISMKHLECSLLRITVKDAETAEPVFGRAMWLTVWGERKQELSLEEMYESYVCRSDEEKFFRFGKRQLLMNKSQTPILGRLANWLQIVLMSYWLLYVTRTEVGTACPEWQKYLPQMKQRREPIGIEATPSQTQYQAGGIFLRFDPAPFTPAKVEKIPPGRQKGMNQEKRERFEVVYLPSKRRKKNRTIETNPATMPEKKQRSDSG